MGVGDLPVDVESDCAQRPPREAKISKLDDFGAPARTPPVFHDLRHTFISRLSESQASDSTVMALAGHVSRAMMERDSHIRMEAKRRAVDDLSGTDFEPDMAQNWAQFFVSEKSDEAKSLKTSGEPGRTRTCNPLIKSQLLYH
jgi:Phage integrase family